MFHMSWEVAVTGQPGKTTHSTELICDFPELFCSQGFLYLLVIFLLISVPIPNSDGNLTQEMGKLCGQVHPTGSGLVPGPVC